jgi:hypothetical protein
MAKIVLSSGNTVLREIVLEKERVAIGRGPHNDIIIDDGAISAEHAVIVTLGDDAFLEDLNSTNGTQVNGQPVKRHFLRNGDVVGLAGFRATYKAIVKKKEDCAYWSSSEILHHQATGIKGIALIRILNGPDAGKEMRLTKVLMTLGYPPTQVAVIAFRLGGYYLTNIEGSAGMSVNGEPLGRSPRRLANNDLIDSSGTQMRFFMQGNLLGKSNADSIRTVDSIRQYDNNLRDG